MDSHFHGNDRLKKLLFQAPIRIFARSLKKNLYNFSRSPHHLCRYSMEVQQIKSRVQKWGNSLALRIPKSFATEVGLKQDSTVEISIAKGKLIINPVKKPEFTLKQLLAQITEDNLHREVCF